MSWCMAGETVTIMYYQPHLSEGRKGPRLTILSVMQVMLTCRLSVMPRIAVTRPDSRPHSVINTNYGLLFGRTWGTSWLMHRRSGTGAGSSCRTADWCAPFHSICSVRHWTCTNVFLQEPWTAAHEGICWMFRWRPICRCTSFSRTSPA
jgi:hypothetical protein